MHSRKLGVPVCIGVGGTIDFLAGKLSTGFMERFQPAKKVAAAGP